MNNQPITSTQSPARARQPRSAARARLLVLLATSLVAFLLAPAWTTLQAASVHNTSGESIGLTGYDPVSYFSTAGPQKGLIKLTHTHDGVVYRFRTQQNLDRFKSEPEKYVPAYGGWCAWAIAELGKRVDIDPLSYEIKYGRLLVFYRDSELDTHDLWKKAPEELYRKAEANWPKLRK